MTPPAQGIERAASCVASPETAQSSDVNMSPRLLHSKSVEEDSDPASVLQSIVISKPKEMPETTSSPKQHPPIQRSYSMAGGSAVVAKANLGSRLRQLAVKKVGEKSDRTQIFRPDLEVQFPRFHTRELQCGRVLGRGGFCVVYEVKKIMDNGIFGIADFRYEKEDLDRQFMKDRYVRHGESRYAMKKLHVTATTDDLARYCEGMVDLAVEVKFLTVLQHPHIIKLRAVSESAPCTDGFFILLDRLYDTLETRIAKWKKEEHKLKSPMRRLFGTGGNAGGSHVSSANAATMDQLMANRMIVGYDMATALLHMHNNNVIYRDLKPENVGFDVRDDVKIFDLGLAKEVLENDKLPDGTYKLTGLTGSLRYMAPEVARQKPYNEFADVYSFGILLHHILTSDTPFQKYSKNMFHTHVIQKGHRPGIPPHWPAPWGALLRKCWAPSWTSRPNMADIANETKLWIAQLQGTVIPATPSGAVIPLMAQEEHHTNLTSISQQSWEHARNQNH